MCEKPLWPRWYAGLWDLAGGRKRVWRFWASLDHLLPIVELNKDFADFLDDTPGRLTTGQLTYFAFHALVGYVLAGFVVAGLTGLTQAG